jgi:hypothetical protein
MSKNADALAVLLGRLVGAFIIFNVTALISAWFIGIFINLMFTPTLLTLVFGVAKITYWKAFCLSLFLNFFSGRATVRLSQEK